MNDNLTIVLLLKDRVNYTLRWLDFANNYLNNIKIIIADGGKDKNIEEKLLNKSSYSNLNYEYVRFPYDKTYKNYFKKIYLSLNKINTEYSILLDNDDFIFENSLSKSINTGSISFVCSVNKLARNSD